ncbi:MAG TPA: hypothetical protein VNZ57_15220 [Longimicrobiales bacterium]|nr:hypothetical protein [Longimicrobiales bacterium]
MSDLRPLRPGAFQGGGGERRCVLVAPHFPPGTGAGALRWEKLCEHLARAGWSLDVLTTDPMSLPARDDTRLAGLPSETRVFGIEAGRVWLDPLEAVALHAVRGLRAVRRDRLRTPEAASTLSAPPRVVPSLKESYSRQELRWRISPDELRRAWHAFAAIERDRAWARAAAAAAAADLAYVRYRAVITSGPPHMVHVAGEVMARLWGIPHVVDMRDPWSLVERLPSAYASQLALRIARRHERRIVRSASAVVTSTEAHRVALSRVYPEAAPRIVTVMNGCDDDAPPASPRNDRFLIVYTGTIYLDRDPRPLFAAAGRIVRSESLPPDEFGIELMGTVSALDGMSVADLARDAGLADHVRLHGPAPRREALALMARATVLVDLPQDSGLAIPSKVFEYMSFPAWLLAMAEPGTATELLLRDTTADVVRPGDVAAIERVLRRRLEQFRRGERPAPLARDGRFSRRAQTGRMLRVLEHVTGATGVHSPVTSG